MSRQSDPVTRLLRARIEQGFPRRCSDPVVMARIAAAIAGSTPKKKEAKHAASPARMA
jgi:hypothetical protein